MGEAAGKLGELFGGLVDDILGIPIVRLALAAIGAYVVLLWLACTWWAFHDMRRRSAEPAAAYLGAGLVVLASPLFFPLALLVYGVLRPGRTLAESRIIRLEHQADLLEEEETDRCPGCGRVTDPQWLSCPACRTRLGYACRGCGRAMELDWSLCAWCGTEFGSERFIPRGDPLVRAPAPAALPVPAAPAAAAAAGAANAGGLVAVGPGLPAALPAGALAAAFASEPRDRSATVERRREDRGRGDRRTDRRDRSRSPRLDPRFEPGVMADWPT